jgi:hypothetical protein
MWGQAARNQIFGLDVFLFAFLLVQKNQNFLIISG